MTLPKIIFILMIMALWYSELMDFCSIPTWPIQQRGKTLYGGATRIQEVFSMECGAFIVKDFVWTQASSLCIWLKLLEAFGLMKYVRKKQILVCILSGQTRD